MVVRRTPDRTLSQTRTVEYVLRQWALWAYVNRGLKCYYPGIEPHERMRARTGGCDISDDEAEAVDAAVSALREDSPKAHDALALHYLVAWPYRHIGKEIGVHHRTAADLVEQGRMYVRAALRFGAPNVA